MLAKLEKSIADVSAAAVKLGTQEGNVVLDEQKVCLLIWNGVI